MRWREVWLVEVVEAGLEVEEVQLVGLAVSVLQLSRVVVVAVDGVSKAMADSHCRNPRVSALTPADSAAESCSDGDRESMPGCVTSSCCCVVSLPW